MAGPPLVSFAAFSGPSAMSHPVLNVAVEAAHAAATIMRRQLQHVDAIPVERKARHDYVSEVDRACEAEIVREIKRFYPAMPSCSRRAGSRATASSCG